MYCGVPSESPVCVIRSPPACCTARAMPKSATSGRAVVQQDVLRLDVAMDHAVPVGVLAARRRPRRRCAPLPRPAAAAPAEPVAQDLAIHERHDVVEEPSASPESKSGRMCGCCRLAVSSISLRKRSAPSTARELGVEHLEGDLPVVARSLGEIHRGHAAPAELALDDVPAGQSGRPTGLRRWSRLITEG